MKRVFTDPSVIPCDELKSVLEADGIPSRIRNEWIAAMTGYTLPLVNAASPIWAWPEIWVSDEDFERASEIVADFQSTTTGIRDCQLTPSVRRISMVLALVLLVAVLLGIIG